MSDELKGILLPDAASPIAGKEYIPGTGGSWLFNLSVLPMEEFGGINMRQLARLHRDPSHALNGQIEVECSRGCGTKIVCSRLFASSTACDPCREKAIEAENIKHAKTYWESICPPSFRDTDTKYAGFPKLQFQATLPFSGAESLLLYGPTRSGKSRLAMLLLQRCMIKFNKHVGVLWPEQLKAIKNSRETLEQIHLWGRYDVLLMDDALLTGAQDERITDWLKDLIDYRMRYNRHHIITSQVGSEDYKQQAEKFGNSTKADEKRVDALLARVRETSRVVSFDAPKAQDQDYQEREF